MVLCGVREDALLVTACHGGMSKVALLVLCIYECMLSGLLICGQVFDYVHSQMHTLVLILSYILFNVNSIIILLSTTVSNFPFMITFNSPALWFLPEPYLCIFLLYTCSLHSPNLLLLKNMYHMGFFTGFKICEPLSLPSSQK